MRVLEWVLLSTALTNLITAIIGLAKILTESKKKKGTRNKRKQRGRRKR